MPKGTTLLSDLRQIIQSGGLDSKQLAVVDALFTSVERILTGQESILGLIGVASDTLVDDDNIILVDATTGAVVITLPDPAGILNYVAGTSTALFIKKIDAGANVVTIQSTSGLIDGSASYGLSAAREGVILIPDGDDWQVLATTTSGGGGGGVTDHGALTGLLDDDHTQYLLADGTRAFSGTLDAGTNNITNIGTVDGRDVSVDGSKLDGIEASATADQTALEVPFTPAGDIAATNTQAAVVEVRDDTDVKLTSKLDTTTFTTHEGSGGAVHSDVVAAGASGFMTGSDKTKLDGIEALADVTDTTNVDTAGAVMDADFAGTELGSLIRTGAVTYAVLKHNLTAVIPPTVNDDDVDGYSAGSKWVDISADEVYFCADSSVGVAVWRRIDPAGVTDHGALSGLNDDDHNQYLLADGTRAMAGGLDMGSFAITNVSNVDGRDVSVDGSKLDGIEALAKDDQTAAEVPFTPDGDIAAALVQDAIVEVRDDTDTKLTGKLDTSHAGTGGAAHANAIASGAAGFMTGTDKAKLDGVESAADVTDATNVNAAGAVMESDFDAQTILAAAADNTPFPLTVAASRLVGRASTGNIAALTAAQVRTILSVSTTSATVLRSLFNAQTILAATLDNTPVALTVAEGRIIGRATGGNVAALTAAQIRTILNVENGAAADQIATEVPFTPDGDIAASTVQAALVEVRDDTDTKLGAKVEVGGQIGGTIASPTILGLRETSGPTNLTLGAVADGEVLTRSGTNIIGAAAGGGAPAFDMLTGFSAGNRYDAAADGYAGVTTGFFFGALVEVLELNPTGGQAIWGNINFGVDGWALGIESNGGLQAYFTDTAGSQVAATSATSDTLNDPVSTYLSNKHYVVLGQVVQNGANNDLYLWVNGQRSPVSTGSNAMAPRTGVAQIGLGAFGNVAEETGIAGVCYYEGTLTDTEIQDWFHACYDAADLVDNGIGMTIFSVKRGAPGATWTESDGTGPDLDRTGALTTKSRGALRLG